MTNPEASMKCQGIFFGCSPWWFVTWVHLGMSRWKPPVCFRHNDGSDYVHYLAWHWCCISTRIPEWKKYLRHNKLTTWRWRFNTKWLSFESISSFLHILKSHDVWGMYVSYIYMDPTMWAHTPYKWPYKWATGLIAPNNWSYNLPIAGFSGPTLCRKFASTFIFVASWGLEYCTFIAQGTSNISSRGKYLLCYLAC